MGPLVVQYIKQPGQIGGVSFILGQKFARTPKHLTSVLFCSQEGVHIGWYQVFQPQVELLDNRVISCRSYHLIDQPSKQDPLPEVRYPSKLYHEVIVAGAIETGIPDDYVGKLKSIPRRAPIPDAAIPQDKVVI